MPLTIGDNFAGYRVLRLLGSGGMGEVYLVQHPRLPRQEALKVLRPDISSDSSFRERFIREADLAAGLRHPHIVGIHDRGEHDSQLWIAMDYIDGTDLAHLVEKRYPAGMPVERVLPIVTAVAGALDYAHKKGLLHRDVKPANIIVADLDTDEANIYLADFGIARPMDDTAGITTTNMTVGTVAYAAPEQLMGETLDGRADQYALAATTYHLLTGAPLFPNSNPAVVISRHLNGPVPVLTDLRPELASLDTVLSAALAKNSDDRFVSNTHFARALTEAAAPQTVRVTAAPTTPAPASRRSDVKAEADHAGTQGGSARPATSKLIGISVAAVLLLLAVIGVLWRPWQHPQSSSTGALTTSTSLVAPPLPAPTSAAPTPPAKSSAAPTVTVTATPTTDADIGFSPSEQAFLDAVASINGTNGYTSGPQFVSAIDGGAASKQQQDRVLVQRGYQLCAALGDGLDSAAARQRVLEPLNNHSIDMFDYYGAIFIGYATYQLCPQYSDKTGQI
ncbi:serine/threonine protein kinase [Mycolicibacterium fluoranthenivorans]|uniref:non-specific serine/threonine protein kinase n=1 Tax=Mycolicibacterium fluoranthenivorans TaxID=258505 RepID=A0A7G8PA31_9MYCO|nr:serine/threonine-protein kinase [Mycolicibacterium fluoranthenivorans]QNJ91197.1 serine/threonine protein kinase [Mycolicibacterium fluoranthenivorans]